VCVCNNALFYYYSVAAINGLATIIIRLPLIEKTSENVSDTKSALNTKPQLYKNDKLHNKSLIDEEKNTQK